MILLTKRGNLHSNGLITPSKCQPSHHDFILNDNASSPPPLDFSQDFDLLPKFNYGFAHHLKGVQMIGLQQNHKYGQLVINKFEVGFGIWLQTHIT